jgi:hypothetical protein
MPGRMRSENVNGAVRNSNLRNLIKTAAAIPALWLTTDSHVIARNAIPRFQMILNEKQKKERGRILQQLADDYHKARPWLKKNEAYIQFGKSLEADPVKLRVINALAAIN